MKNIVNEEHIGKEIIVESKNEQINGLKGKIIDETKNTYTIKTKQGKKRIIKNQVKIIFLKERIMVDGKKLLKRPEDRVNK
ncbi:MAG: ribonuclease P protein subunit [Candidatus Woesearchaeota archaeon]